jgi:uncharacterized delta-60 repeat protein
VISDFGSFSRAGAVAVQSDGRIVVAGGTSASDFALARYTRDGKLDPTFGDDGQVVTNFGCIAWYPDCGMDSEEEAQAVVVQADGKIVAAGSSDVSGRTGEKGCCIRAFALVRYLPDGSLDPSFGTEGKVVTPFPGNAYAEDLAIEPDGAIVAAGGGAGYFALARYTTQGRLDPTFGVRGKVTTNFG